MQQSGYLVSTSMSQHGAGELCTSAPVLHRNAGRSHPVLPTDAGAQSASHPKSGLASPLPHHSGKGSTATLG